MGSSESGNMHAPEADDVPALAIGATPAYLKVMLIMHLRHDPGTSGRPYISPLRP